MSILKPSLAFLALALVAVPLSAQTTDKVFAKFGPFIVHRIAEKGVFDRCALTLDPGPSMLRIAWNKDRIYSMSVPPASTPVKPLMMHIDLGRLGSYSFDAKTNGKRAWTNLDNNTVDKLLQVKRQIAVKIGNDRYVWQLGNVTMEDAFIKLEDCVHNEQRRR